MPIEQIGRDLVLQGFGRRFVVLRHVQFASVTYRLGCHPDTRKKTSSLPLDLPEFLP